MSKPPYVNGQWAISVQDMDSGEQIVSLNADKMFEPGSVVKNYSTGAAWQQFGPDSTILTPVKRTGEVVDGTLNGDLILVGMGDLTMGGRTKPDGTVDFTNLDHNDANGIPGATLTTEDPLTGLDQLAAQVKAAGISSVSGDVVIDDRLWEPHSLSNGPVSPIIINQNVIDFISTPTTQGQPATSELVQPKVAPWVVSGQIQTVAAGGKTAITVESADEKTVVLSGTIAADSGPVVNTYSFKDPATFARTAFIEALGRAGVTVTTDPVAANPSAALPDTSAVGGLTSVAELTSLSFDQEATYVLKISYNLGGEAFLCRLAVAAGSTDCGDGLKKAAEIWTAAGLDTTGASLIDGSGLAGNLITADNQVQLSKIMAARPDAARWKAALPILGVDGSLTTVQADGPAKGKVSAKTGTLAAWDAFNERYRLPTKALGGYIDTKSGRHFAFTIMATNSVFADVEGIFAANDDVGKVVASIQQSY
ncbi:MAG: D-alanyl-D-alanine carboxypeptidase/D-alanyl-D-alanine-endopeptidase [Nakamurella sp.]